MKYNIYKELKFAIGEALDQVPQVFPITSRYGSRPIDLFRNMECASHRKHNYETNERDIILLVENRSVAGFDYRHSVNLIADNIDCLLHDGDFEDLTFDINEYEDYKIDIANHVLFLINFHKGYPSARYIDKYTEINDGYAEKILIQMNVGIDNYDKQTVQRLLYHELNHAKEDVSRKLNGSKGLNDELLGNDCKIDYNKVYGELIKLPLTSTIQYLIYYLFIDTEFNAVVAESYADFETNLTQREEFHNEIKKTSTFKRHEWYKTIIQKLENSNEWESIALTYFNKIPCKKENFRNWFIDEAKKKCGEYWYRIGKVASLYFDTIEQKDKEQL